MKYYEYQVRNKQVVNDSGFSVTIKTTTDIKKSIFV